jgi:hypothetical protein
MAAPSTLLETLNASAHGVASLADRAKLAEQERFACAPGANSSVSKTAAAATITPTLVMDEQTIRNSPTESNWTRAPRFTQVTRLPAKP